MKNKKLLYFFTVIILLLAVGIGMYKYLNSKQSKGKSSADTETIQNESGVSEVGVPPSKPSPSGN